MSTVQHIEFLEVLLIVIVIRIIFILSPVLGILGTRWQVYLNGTHRLSNHDLLVISS